MIRKIVTHPGGAHKDDFLAVCVLIARTSASVERRTPKDEEIADEEVALVDIGGQHEPQLNNFDHHHFPREHEPTCALSLVLMHLDLYKDALMFCDWLEPAEWFDSRGPNKTADWLGVDRTVVARLNSPIDVTLLRRFARRQELRAGDTIYEVMRMIGEDLLEFIQTARRRLDRTAAIAKIWTLEFEGKPAKVVFLPRSQSVPEEPSASLARFVRSEGLQNEVIALAYPDRRGSGYGLTRFNDHPRLDFSQVESEEDVHFAHKTGFMCKTGTTDEHRLQELIEGAWVQ